MQFQLELTQELFCLGGAASILIEVLRALLLDIERYPRIKALWRYLPFIAGALLILAFPEATPGIKSPLVLMMHGAISPSAFYLAYPQLQKLVQAKAAAPPTPSPQAPEPAKEPTL